MPWLSELRLAERVGLYETIQETPDLGGTGRVELNRPRWSRLCWVAPSEVAARVLEAVREERFWILTHANAAQRAAARLEPILEGTDPVIAL